MKLFDITPAGKIVIALLGGRKSFNELKLATGLSERWLSITLKKLVEFGMVKKAGNTYELEDFERILKDPMINQYLKLNASIRGKAYLIARELGEDEDVLAVILFGSVAKGIEREDSDIDFLVITRNEAEKKLLSLVQKLMLKYDVPVEVIFMSLYDFLANISAKTSLIFGILEGYEMLIDKISIKRIIQFVERDIKSKWMYIEELGAWLPRK